MLAESRRLTYRECAPPAALAGVVECFWRREPWRLPTEALGVLPDGRVDVIWANGGRVVVIGPQTRALGRPLPPESSVIGVRFLPGVGPPLLGVPAHELADTHVALDAIDTRAAASLLRDLRAIGSAPFAPTAIARAVAVRLDSHRGFDPLVQRATSLLRDPTARTGCIAKALAISERQLQRRFREAVGYGPKTLQRILRFQRVLTALARDGDIARTSAVAGYSDQSHLTRETLEFSGLSPQRLARILLRLNDEGALGALKTGRRGMATPVSGEPGTGSRSGPARRRSGR
jgi:AraC-like DNA-binding protein